MSYLYREIVTLAKTRLACQSIEKVRERFPRVLHVSMIPHSRVSHIEVWMILLDNAEEQKQTTWEVTLFSLVFSAFSWAELKVSPQCVLSHRRHQIFWSFVVLHVALGISVAIPFWCLEHWMMLFPEAISQNASPLEHKVMFE